MPTRPGRVPAPPVPTVRGVVRVVPVPAATVRAKASVPESIDPEHREVPPYPAPRPRDSVRESKEAARERAADREAQAREAADRRARDRSQPEERAPQTPDATAGEVEGRPVVTVTAAEPHRPAVPDPSDTDPAARRPRRRLRLLAPLVAALLAATVTATVLIAERRSGRDDAVGRWAGVAAEVTPSGPTAAPPGTTAPAPLGVPTRLKVKAIGVDTALEWLRLGDDGRLTPPKDVDWAGWYADSARPGDVGPAVIAGHVESGRGPAVFHRLPDLRPGDRIDVVRGGRTVRFTVTSTAWYPKRAFPTGAVFGPTPDRQLRLITCGDVADRSSRSYRENLVVSAVAG